MTRKPMSGPIVHIPVTMIWTRTVKHRPWNKEMTLPVAVKSSNAQKKSITTMPLNTSARSKITSPKSPKSLKSSSPSSRHMNWIKLQFVLFTGRSGNCSRVIGSSSNNSDISSLKVSRLAMIERYLRSHQPPRRNRNRHTQLRSEQHQDCDDIRHGCDCGGITS